MNLNVAPAPRTLFEASHLRYVHPMDGVEPSSLSEALKNVEPWVRAEFKAEHERQERERATYSIDLLTAAWQWTQAEIAHALLVPPNILRDWRNRDALPDGTQIERLRLLQSIQYNLWVTGGDSDPSSYYAAWWRRPMPYFNGGTPIDVVVGSPDGLGRIMTLLNSAH